MEAFLMLCFIFGFPAAALAVLPAAIEDSLKAFIIAFFKSLVLIVLPFWAFVGSCFLFVSAYKGACALGWMTCFHTGKLWFAPFVVWALLALYRLDVLPQSKQNFRPPYERRWVRWGILDGAVISTFCFIHGLLHLGSATIPVNGFSLFGMLVPFYTAAWFCFRTGQLFVSSKLKPLESVLALLCTIPGWIASLYWSYKTYLALPDEPPECFIVTAASRGHRGVVGPTRLTERSGRTREANSQLIVFWEFERLWQERLPRWHRVFRACYNRIGPVIAGRVRSPLAADAVYLMLKPAEWVARVVVWIFRWKSLNH